MYPNRSEFRASLAIALAFGVQSVSQEETPPPVRTLVDRMLAFQQPVEDFRCEFEGSIRIFGDLAKRAGLEDGGVKDDFSGLFVWKNGGETFSQSLHRHNPGGAITHETLAVRPEEGRSELHRQSNLTSVGDSTFDDPRRINSWNPGCLGYIFLIDKIRRDIADKSLVPETGKATIDGRALDVLSVSLKTRPPTLVRRYWIDLSRNGHVVRMETYLRAENQRIARLDIILEKFKVLDIEVWMPVSGQNLSYLGLDEQRKPKIFSEPRFKESIYVVQGTMQFNRHPGPEVFTIKYKPGTPISDNLRKLQYEFGAQKIGSRPTKAEAEQMLNEAVAKAEEQKKELVAVAKEGIDWTAVLMWGFGAAVLVSLVALWIQRRR